MADTMKIPLSHTWQRGQIVCGEALAGTVARLASVAAALNSTGVELLLQVLHLCLQTVDVAGHLRAEGVELSGGIGCRTGF